MLKDLRRYEHFGTPNFYSTLLKFISKHKNPITKEVVNKYFYGKTIDGRRGFRGAVEFAIKINVLVEDKGFISVDKGFYSSYVSSENLESFILTNFFLKINNSDYYSEIFNPDNFSFTHDSRKLIMKNTVFKFKYSNVKYFLLDFGFLTCDEENESRFYNVESKYLILLNVSILPEISKKKRRISVSEFEKSMEDRNKYGHEAELFVYNFECARLFNLKKPDWTSLHTVNKGYDITSYNFVDDLRFNRFIEVKSFYGDKPYFYLSENEYKTAGEIGKKYWLYLVNRKYIDQQGYEPIIIQDPYANIFSNPNWKMTEERTYKFSQA